MFELTVLFLHQAAKDRRNNFLRRTKATAPPDTTDTDTATTDNVETTTTKYSRRGVSKFKSRKELEKAGKESERKEGAKEVAKKENGSRRPSLSGGARRSERPTRTFVRRRLGGANSTTSTTTASSATSSAASATRRPFRVASRRRPASTTTGTVPTTTDRQATTDQQATTDRQVTTETLASEEYLQDIEDTDIIEDPTLEPRLPNSKKTSKVQRRPLINLKEEVGDQNPSATNEDERKRQSKKYSSSFKQNQLDEVLRRRAQSHEEANDTTERKTTVADTTERKTTSADTTERKTTSADTTERKTTSADTTERKTTSADTTERKTTAADDFTAETAVAIAAHQLLAAPIPSLQDFEEPTKPTKKYPQTTQVYYTSAETEPVTDRRKTERTVYFDDFTSTPVYKSSSPRDYGTTGQVFADFSTEYAAPKLSTSTFTVPKSTYRTSTYPVQDIQPPASPTPTIINPGLSGVAPTNAVFSRVPVTDSERTRPITKAGLSSVASPTPRFIGPRAKLIPVPVEDYPFSTRGYTGVSQEPAYFTREYLLESPVTKTYDDEYQYLSPVTPPQTTRKPLRKKIIHRKISTTIRPTTPTYVPPATTAKPRRGSVRAKLFEKVKPTPNRNYKPIENYDYYDDSAEKVAEKYSDETKVVVHGKGNIECLDIGNFPHPSSCKKFISCARMEGDTIIGWEYICPKGLSFDPVGGICNWSAGLGCDEKDL